MPKKKWTTPQLIVLTRRNHEESVLASCKQGLDWAANWPEGEHLGCILLTDPDLPRTACTNCSAIDAS